MGNGRPNIDRRQLIGLQELGRKLALN